MSSSSIDDILKEMNANLSWYQLNSNFNDPMYQYVLRLHTNTLSNTPRTNFSVVLDLSNVVDMSPILRYGSYPCSAPGKEAYLDSGISCAIFQFPYFLENLQFGYLCGLVIIPIMLISLFGKIQESYRWFLLNQAIFDAFMCYSFICEKPSALAWSGANYVKNSTCFYSGRSSNPLIDALFMLIKGACRNAPYIPLFLLAFSRCISLYFPKFYQKHNKTWKILAFIIIFDFVAIFLSTSFKLLSTLKNYIQGIAIQNCFAKFCPPQFQNYTAENFECLKTNEKYFQCKNERVQYFDKFSIGDKFYMLSFTPAMVCIVLISVIALFFKIAVQLKYQLKHNRHAFLKTYKVAVVIFIQTISLSFYLALLSFQQYLFFNVFKTFNNDTSNFQALPYSTFLLQSFATTTSINIIRIFFDSFIVLMVLSGYRKRLFRFGVFIFSFYKNPFFIRDFKNYFGKSSYPITPSTTAVRSIPIS